MARLPRYSIAGVPQHVIQRGNNKNTVFFADVNREFYLAVLQESADKSLCDVHAYVLMTNHVHLLATPKQPNGISRMMQGVGSHYASYINHRCGRTGGIWEGRYRSTVVDSESYLLTCYRYIELNPVRAGIVDLPEEYRWSSYRRNALGVWDPVVTPHALYRGLGSDEWRRMAAYRELFDEHLTDDEVFSIRSCTHRGWVLGSAAFGRDIEALSGRAAVPRKRGRKVAQQKRGRD